MYFVYLLTNPDASERYVGFTSDLKRRFTEHKKGIRTARAKPDWELAYYEAYRSLADARKREDKLKHHGSAKKKLFDRLTNSLSRN